MFRLYRNIEPGEVIVVGGDCSQGGADENFAQFLSKTKLDVPLVYQKRGVAAEMTTDIYPALERIFIITGVKPLVAFERNNGGASEMQRLQVLNREGKYELFIMPKIGTTAISQGDMETNHLGWDTNIATRPVMLGELKSAIGSRLITIYDEETLSQLKTFVVNRQGKPEATKGKRDDAVISLSIAFQLQSRHSANSSDWMKENQSVYGKDYHRINEGLKEKWSGAV